MPIQAVPRLYWKILRFVNATFDNSICHKNAQNMLFSRDIYILNLQMDDNEIMAFNANGQNPKAAIGDIINYH